MNRLPVFLSFRHPDGEADAVDIAEVDDSLFAEGSVSAVFSRCLVYNIYVESVYAVIEMI